MKTLIENEADISSKDACKYTALHYGALQGHTEAVRLLLQNGADVEAEVLTVSFSINYARNDTHQCLNKTLSCNYECIGKLHDTFSNKFVRQGHLVFSKFSKRTW